MAASEAKKKKIAIIAVLVVLLVAMIVAVTVGVKMAKKGNKKPAKVGAKKKAIETICQPTTYKETCQSSLEKEAGDTTDPKDLIKAGFKVAADKVNEVIKNSNTLKEHAKDPMTSQALGVCKELLETAVEDLLGAVDKMGPFDASKIDDYLADLKVWLSAAVNHQATCLDAFKDTKGEAGEKMKGFLKTAQELTSNGLAMVSEISRLVGSPKLNSHRRLMSSSKGGQRNRNYKPVPGWMSDRDLDLLTATPESLKPNVVVAKDGTGKYKTINEALKEVPQKSKEAFVIYIKKGVYEETVIVDKQMTNVVMIGDGPTMTRISGSKSHADGVTTMKTATFAALGNYFVAKGIGFENTAGHVKHQAVALRVQSDFSIFFNCHMDAYQDTLYTQTYRQFYRDCTITGTVDFIFGDGVALFQNCKMVVRKPGETQACMVTAQGRTDHNEITGIFLQNCTITGEPDYMAVKDKNKAYLGRPWKNFARVVVMQSSIDEAIAPEGWTEWTGEEYHQNCFFGEYGNTGPGSDVTQRVKWSTVKRLTPDQAAAFTPARVFEGDKWIKPSGVPYVPGMMPV
ncbi:putative pectinesterase/pectinesterase inhibitor 28 [Pyrus x bretschneideri]|uniref:putative pectinesterase/pectinesterase inhibitor 28 n=1 Tax=Pyrus x bretschneideri TaxID=225117 RepID=UPI00051187EC|nr:putative pectinesterase/pectinesterase inhibitor 28 [Pyrus x bretschneideri]